MEIFFGQVIIRETHRHVCKVSKHADLQKRLSSYWKMELASFVFLPVSMFYLAWLFGSAASWISLFCIIPMSGVLLVGGMYWRGKYLSLARNPVPLQRSLSLANILQRPLLLLTMIVSLLVILIWSTIQFQTSMGDKIISTTAAVLAILEYINYYHRQLQHFDHRADFQRFMRGKGFRRSQMNRDLKRWRQHSLKPRSA